jgi:hypothetical protein
VKFGKRHRREINKSSKVKRKWAKVSVSDAGEVECTEHVLDDACRRIAGPSDTSRGLVAADHRSRRIEGGCK